MSASRCSSLDAVDTASSLLDSFLDEKESQSNIFYSRAVGLVTGDVKSRGVVNVHRYAVEARVDSQPFLSCCSKTLSFPLPMR